MRLKGLFVFTLSTVVGLMSLSFSDMELYSISNPKRVVVVSKTYNNQAIDNALKKYKHIKVKNLSFLKDAQVVLVDDTELTKLKSDETIQVFEDAVVKVEKPKESKNQNVQQQIPWGVTRIGADKAWSNTTGKGIKIAVVDTGITKHKDLKKNVKGEFNAIEPGQPAIDECGHGVHVAGIIAAEDNKVGTVGIAPNDELYAVKDLDANGEGYLSDIVEGIEWSISNGMQIINLSLGFESDFPLLRDSINKAIDAGLIVVAAAGNTNGGRVSYPALYENVFSISAIDKTDKIADFSAVGKIDFCAPGVDIYSTYINNSYSYLSGTSMAAPHVTGVITLIMSDNKNDIDKDGIVSANEVREIIANCTEDLGLVGYDELYGNGVVRAN